MKQSVTKRLTNIILDENGILAVTKAIVTGDIQSPEVWSHCTTVAKLISATLCGRCEDYARKLSIQVRFCNSIFIFFKPAIHYLRT